MKLTNKECQNAKATEKAQKLSDGRGLYLLVQPNGAKYWRVKYRFLGKEKTLSLGVYPEVSLAEAREKCHEARKQLGQHIDPSEAKKQIVRDMKITQGNTFQAIAKEWIELKQEQWSDGYYRKLTAGLEKNVYPFIGHRPVAKITAPELLNDCLRKIEKRGSLKIAAETRQVCSLVFRYAAQTGRCEHDPAATLRGALKPHRTEHFRTICKDTLASLAT